MRSKTCHQGILEKFLIKHKSLTEHIEATAWLVMIGAFPFWLYSFIGALYTKNLVLGLASFTVLGFGFLVLKLEQTVRKIS